MIVPLLVAAVALVQTPSTDTAGAYLDAAARRLVAAARARRETIDRSITGYQTTLRERIGVGIRALRRDRMLYRRELALRIDWRRDSLGRITVLGARESVPIALPKAAVPDSIQHEVDGYAFDPADDRLTVGFGGDERSENDTSKGHHDNVQFSHPLAPGAERDYRYASGDSSVINFGNGQPIRLRELRIIPRRLDFRLMAGSFWIDEDSHAVIRALIRPARPFDLDRDLNDPGDDDIPAFLKPIRIEVRFLTVDYGLWAGHWWLPRLIAMDAVATAGSFLQVPVRYELEYSDYTVSGDTTRLPEPRVAEAGAAPSDSAARASCKAQGADVECRCRHGHCRGFVVTVPADTPAVLASAALPPPFSLGDSLLASGEMDELARALHRLPQAPWQFHARPPRWGLARYNRVEGLSLGARGEVDLGRLRVDGTARIATSDAALDLEGGVVRETLTKRVRLAGYHRLAAVDPAARSLSIGNSLNALVLGRDDGFYFRASGADLTIAPAVTLAQRFSLRVYAEQQRPARKRTDFSLRRALFHGAFLPNVAADSADQIGAELAFHAQRGSDAEHAQLSSDVTIDGAGGTFGFGRASGTLRLAAPIGRRALAGAVEVAGGTSAGTVPLQSRWYLGGPATLRGYDGGVSVGDAFWRARLELANQWPAARLVVFGDVGRAGPRAHLSLAQPLAGIGAGVSFLDGLIRVDLTRAVRGPVGWRVDFYTDAAL